MFGRYAKYLLAAAMTLVSVVPALAITYDPPTVEVVDFGTNKLTVSVTAGPSGCPDGFSVYWMTAFDYEDYGSVWPDNLGYPTLRWAIFNGTPTLNTFEGVYDTFNLGPNQTILIELGDLEDETGVTTNTVEELVEEENFVVCGFATAGSGNSRSDYSLNGTGTTVSKKDCVKSQGYWKNHSSQWPVNSLVLGTVNYTKAQLLSILNKSANGNGLISMAKQLIAAKLNIANGAQPTPTLVNTVTAADAQIGALVVPPVGSGYLSPSSTSSKTQKLDDFNNGHKYNNGCGSVSTGTSSWGRLKALYR